MTQETQEKSVFPTVAPTLSLQQQGNAAETTGNTHHSASTCLRCGSGSNARTVNDHFTGDNKGSN
jgi:hypothetical protein